MTWYVWHVSPFVTSIFFVLGVFTLYQLLFDGCMALIHNKNLKINDHTFNSWFGVIYMLIFIFSMQSHLVGKSISWEFMNFQIVALIFCAYFLKIHIPWYLFFPIILVYMVFNSSIGYWESWCHAITLISFYWTMNVVRNIFEKSKYEFFYYMIPSIIFGALMWFFVAIKFSLSPITFLREWLYLMIFEVLIYSYVTMLLRDRETMTSLISVANHDALTKTQNYAAYKSKIGKLFDNSTKNNLDLSMMMFDIDHFKVINDTYGHLAGDRVLQKVSEAAQTVIDENDKKVKLYRTGGEEFNVVFPGYDLNDAESIVEQIFSAVNHLKIKFEGQEISITISIGVSQMSKKDLSDNDFYNRVDTNLYNSKRNGRTQITAV